MGFCFVNNVAVAASHGTLCTTLDPYDLAFLLVLHFLAYHKYGVDRVIILDIDLVSKENSL